MNENKNISIVCFGEVLWDIFPTGERAGGAPFNVAYNSYRMGSGVVMLSKVGNDALGKRLTDQIKGWGITTDFIQVDDQYPTGTVLAKFDEHGDAHYDIVQNVAWDFIQIRPSHQAVIQNADAFVFGSLAARNETSRKALFQFLEWAKFKVFDVNFRAPFVNFDLIKKLLHRSDLVKMNKAELRQIINFLGEVYVDEETSVKHIQYYFNINEVVLTKGSKGARYFVGDQNYTYAAVPIKIADTVGSGDSFLAGFLQKRLLGRPPEEIMKQAVSLGAYITSKTGACPNYTYEEFRDFREHHSVIK